MTNQKEKSNRIFQSLSLYSYEWLTFIILIAVIKFLYAIYFSINDRFIISAFQYFLKGIVNDLNYWIYLFVIIFPVFLVLFFVQKKTSVFILRTIIFISVIIESLLQIYFAVSEQILTYASIQNVSDEQVEIVTQIYGYNKYQLFWLIIPLVVFHFIWYILVKKTGTLKNIIIVLSLFLMSIVLSLVFDINQAKSISNNNTEIFFNKSKYFITSYFNYLNKEEELNNVNLDSEVAEFYNLHGIQNKNYPNYPFYFEEEIPNTLGEYFLSSDTPPNVVFIICESLGSQFIEENNTAGSFMPFLDSLCNEGLFWSNCIANSERTFGVLPNLLGGLPEAKNGFMNLKAELPNHLTLPQLLHDNYNYFTSFFCGALKDFDNMNDFLMFQKFDLITGKFDYTLNQSKTRMVMVNGDVKNFNWGAEDEIVFNESFHKLDSSNVNQKPYMSVFLTTTTHPPFNFSDKINYLNLSKDILKKRNLDDKYNFMAETFASYLYLDESLRHFFKRYSYRDDFKNTIFVITGDHSVTLPEEQSRFEHFIVPLLIYSPLIKNKITSDGLVCHKDVMPSLVTLLIENFHINLPKFKLSFSNGLSVKNNSTGFETVCMNADKTMSIYIQDNFVLMDDVLYRLKSNLILEEIENEELKSELKLKLGNYHKLSSKICEVNSLFPSEIYDKWSTEKTFAKINWDFEKSQYMLLPKRLQSFIDSSESYEGEQSLNSRNEKYLGIIDRLKIKSKHRYHIKVCFAIKTSHDLPSLVSFRKSSQGEILERTILLNKLNSDINKSTPEWQYFNFAFWIDKQGITDENEFLGMYLFQNSNAEFFIDNLEIKIREF